MFSLKIAPNVINKMKANCMPSDIKIYHAFQSGLYSIVYSYDPYSESIVYEAALKEGYPNEYPGYIQAKIKPDGTYFANGKGSEPLVLYVSLKERRINEEDPSKLKEFYAPILNSIKAWIDLDEGDIQSRQALRSEFKKCLRETYREPKHRMVFKFAESGNKHVSLTLNNRTKNHFSLRISYEGCGVSYISKFIDAYDRNGSYELTPGSYEEIVAKELDLESRQIIEAIKMSLSGGAETISSDEIWLTPEQFLEFVFRIPGSKVFYNGYPYMVSKEPNEVLMFGGGDKPLQFKPSFKEGSLRIKKGKKLVIIDTNNFSIDEYYFKYDILASLYSFFDKNGIGSYPLIQDIFIEEATPLLKPYLLSSCASIASLENSFKIDLYISINSDKTLSFETKYTHFGEVKPKNDVIKNIEIASLVYSYEHELDMVGGIPNGKISNEESISRFLKSDLSQLKRFCDIYLNDGLKDLKVSYLDGLDFSINKKNDWFTLSIGSNEFSKEELKSILAACKKKKRFVLLKDRAIILDEERLKPFEVLLDEIYSRDLVDEVEMPFYQLMKMDDMLIQGFNVDKYGVVSNALSDLKNYRDISIDIPEHIAKNLKPYQVEGVKWLYSLRKYRLSGILADDMGLGKTLQTVALISLLKEDKPILVVSPKSVIYNWENEFNKWDQTQKVLVIDGNKDERKSIYKSIDQNEKKVYVISYDSLRNDIDDFADFSFSLIVLDEAQYIKNYNSKKSVAVKKLSSISKLALTGTPIENRLSDLWSLFDFLMPKYLHSLNKFKTLYQIPISENDPEAKSNLRKRIAPFILRRTKTSVLKELPKKTVVVLKISMTPDQLYLYNGLLKATRETFFEKDKISMLAALTRLRQICVDPSCFIDDYNGESAKINYLLDRAGESIEAGHKLLIFSSFTTVLENVLKKFKKEKIRCFYICGSVPAEDRVRMAEEFNKSSSEVKVMLVSLKAGGTGLNLNGADTVIHLDPWWNYAAEEQATDRAYRIGQKRPVTVLKLICHDSIEEKVINLQESKKELFDTFIKEGDKALLSLSDEDLAYILS